MRQIKSWIRSTMSNNSLNKQIFYSIIHKNRIDDVCTNIIAQNFTKPMRSEKTILGRVNKDGKRELWTNTFFASSTTPFKNLSL